MEGDVAVLSCMYLVTLHILIAAGIHVWFIGTRCEIHCRNGVQTLYIICMGYAEYYPLLLVYSSHSNFEYRHAYVFPCLENKDYTSADCVVLVSIKDFVTILCHKQSRKGLPSVCAVYKRSLPHCLETIIA